MKVKKIFPYCGLILILGIIFWLAVTKDIKNIYLDTDIARDLSELSNLWLHKMVWLGPRLSPGLHASPIYYYLLYPGLIVFRGSAYSVVYTTLIISMICLWLFGWLGIKKFGPVFLIAVLLIGTAFWWRTIAVHPGNGYTYGLWIFIGLTTLYFQTPLFFSAIFLGMAIAYHPATILILPILFYQWWEKDHQILSLICILIGLIAPWTPIIVFEIITKGFLTRQWLTNPGSGITLTNLNFNNLSNLVLISGLNNYLAGGLLLLTGFFIPKKLKIWFGLSFIPLIFFAVVSLVPTHYLYGTVCLWWFLILITLIQNKIGTIFLLVLSLFFIGKNLLFTSTIHPTRTITKIKSVVDKLEKTGKIDKNKKIAVVAALDNNTKVPQADDYRFFLRIKGYQVLDVQQYSQAKNLIMFIEQPNFDWEKWSTWEIEQSNCRKKIYQYKIEGINVIVWQPQ